MENKKTNDLIVKSNQMIEASYKLSLQEQYIVLYMASKIHKDDEAFKPVKIKIKEFADIMGVQNTNHTYLQQVTKDLLSKVLIIKEKNITLQVGWLSSAKYFHQEGAVEFCFDPNLKPYLLQLKERFTQINMRKVIRLKSTYSIRFYELLKQYEPIGCRYFELEGLRTILGINKDEYTLYSNFKLKILNPVKKEFDLKYSTGDLDFTFQYKETKAGRRVEGLKIEILKPEIQQKAVEIGIDDSGTAPTQNALEAELSALKVSKKQITTLLKKYTPEVIQRNIDLAKRKAADNELKSIPAFLLAAIEGDFASSQEHGANPDQHGLILKANSCWAKTKGGCGAVWANYKDNKTHECHFCKKFKGDSK